jgi:hypothetical protein
VSPVCENDSVNDETPEHKHIYSVVLGGNMGDNDDQSWVATCRECGHTERGDDAPNEIGIFSWSGEPPLGNSEDVTRRAP